MVTAILLSASAARAAPALCLNPEVVRRFLAAQNEAWNNRDFQRFYATFDRNARIVAGKTSHSVAADERDARRFFSTAKAGIRESDTVIGIAGRKDGSVEVEVRETTIVRTKDETRTLHALTTQTLAIRGGRIVSLGLTEKDYRHWREG